ncbi:MAG: NAD(P)/FAD-dependent oxidoreductase, partial [Halieaceae bacterium]
DLSGKIRLESVVTDILWGEELCGVIYKDRGIESAVTSRRVIVTLPVGVLHSGDVAFKPPLPKAKQRALDGLGMGQAVVLPMLFDEPFWRDTIPYPGGLKRLDEQVSFTIPHDNKRGGNAINGYFTADAAQQMSELGEEAALKQALSWLEQATGVSGLEDKLSWHAFADWVTDPYSYGCYSITRPGGHGLREEFAKPVGKTLFFAGEATAPAPHYQSVHGAYASGKRVAGEVAASMGLSDRLPGDEGTAEDAVIELL